MSAPSTTRGRPDPIGATVAPGGVNFCVYAKHATRVELLLFAHAEDAAPRAAIPLDPVGNRTGDYWHVHVEGVRAGALYGYRVDGPSQPPHRFDATKLLVDPYARAVANTENYDRRRAAAPGDNTAVAIKSVVVDPADYDWEGDAPLQRAFVDSVIYEMHVAGFTKDSSSGISPAKRGTYGGLVEKIPYLVDLGIKTVELMPVQQFDPQAAPNGVNYWGYQPLAWFAPHRGYSSQKDLLAPVREFRDVVKALHRADIEVILDVVFNHTAEDDENGPTLSLRGFDNSTYYLVDPRDGKYLDFTGCGNTINGNDAEVRRMILDCLRYWVREMHVDGFRFDLAAALSRDRDGKPLARPPILLDIAADPALAATKIIAEAWDAGGLYELTDFAGDRWSVWNGRYRDTVRRFAKSDAGAVSAMADSLVASASLFGHAQRLPTRSVNFITSHDGFTLNDLVSYDEKHNEANGEDNHDGTNGNFSWNCGVEGPTDDPQIESLRRRQIKNFATVLLFSEGRPMILMGDEVRRTQHGNNNAYCQDTELSWFDWSAVARHADIHRFFRSLIHFHQQSEIFRDRGFWGEPNATRITWHGVHLDEPDWGDDARTLAFELFHPSSREHLHIMLNAFWEPLEFELPETAPETPWRRLIDTGQESPLDFCDPPPAVAGNTYRCPARSAVVLVAANRLSS